MGEAYQGHLCHCARSVNKRLRIIATDATASAVPAVQVSEVIHRAARREPARAASPLSQNQRSQALSSILTRVVPLPGQASRCFHLLSLGFARPSAAMPDHLGASHPDRYPKSLTASLEMGRVCWNVRANLLRSGTQSKNLSIAPHQKLRVSDDWHSGE
jgi:hypothetical protein